MSNTFDFGNGPVPAHQHLNGGGWVADTAYVGPDARVYDYAWVAGGAWASGMARISGQTKISKGTHI